MALVIVLSIVSVSMFNTAGIEGVVYEENDFKDDTILLVVNDDSFVVSLDNLSTYGVIEIDDHLSNIGVYILTLSKHDHDNTRNVAQTLNSISEGRYVAELNYRVYPDDEPLSPKDAYLQKLFDHYGWTKENYDAGEFIYEYLGVVDTDNDEIKNYAIVYAHWATCPEACDGGVVGDRYFWQGQLFSPFRFGYALYDLENDKFIQIDENILTDYPFVADIMDEYLIGTPFGDADGDKVLTVMDATFIQRSLVNLVSFPADEYFLEYGNYPTQRRSDINFDSSVDILDATAIQLKLSENIIPDTNI